MPSLFVEQNIREGLDYTANFLKLCRSPPKKRLETPQDATDVIIERAFRRIYRRPLNPTEPQYEPQYK